jgi:uncharacterized protein YndB with AHSA1/START domain
MNHDLRLERVYDAAPEIVLDAFTDPVGESGPAWRSSPCRACCMPWT